MPLTACIVQARLGSERLPRKVLADLAGVPLIVRVLERAQAIPGVDVVALAVPLADSDGFLPIVRPLLQTVHVPVHVFAYPGDPSDVLARYLWAAEVLHADTIVRVTGDCPLLAPDVCGAVLDLFHDRHAEYASNDTTWTGYPDGMDCEVFSRGLLRATAAMVTMPYGREHVTPLMKLTDKQAALLAKDDRLEHVKLSVDSPADLERVRAVYAALSSPQAWTFAETLAACERVGLVPTCPAPRTGVCCP